MNRLPCVALLCLISFVTDAKAAEEAKESDESSGTIVQAFRHGRIRWSWRWWRVARRIVHQPLGVSPRF